MSRRSAVRGVRYALGAVALLIVAAIYLLTEGGSDDGLSVSGVDLTDLSDGLKLSNPRFTGQTGKGEPFVLTANWAIPDGPRPTEVELNEITGEIHQADGRVVKVSADSGMLFPKTDVVNVAGNVRLTRSDGYDITVGSATLNIADGALSATGPVDATGPMGRITSGSLRAERDGAAGDGDYIWFENRVNLRIDQPNAGLTTSD